MTSSDSVTWVSQKVYCGKYSQPSRAFLNALGGRYVRVVNGYEGYSLDLYDVKVFTN